MTTDDELDRMVHDADPYQPGVALHGDALRGARESLLEEIMSADRVVTPWRRRLLTAVAAAAAVTGVLAVSVAVSHRSGGQATATPPTSSATPSYDAGTWNDLVLRAAEQNPRLLIDEPGWKVTSVYGFVEADGEITFTNGDRGLEMNWYPAREYQGYYEDRLDVSAPQPGKVDGWPGDVFTYSADDFAIMLRPRDDVFAELRTRGKWTRATFGEVLTHIKRVDVKTWLAALPPEIVTPGKAKEATAKVLAGVPLPPRFDADALTGVGTNDPYQFGAQVMARVGCGWIDEWLRARKAGDEVAARQAVTAMSGSHGWKILNDMSAEGGYPEVFWQYADEMAAGNQPDGYREGLGCP
ncbi:hypothetical protein ACQP2F_27000 [Actinoplanes sp. CA-030573]|uniref:hypothetical protein n=1 Tax=Actinoplanes sp. CA-030573 TaxID=3239898 RepID=UPI003D8DB4F5